LVFDEVAIEEKECLHELKLSPC